VAGYVETMRKRIGHDRLILAGASVYVYRDGKVLLQKRKDDGYWSDHGGCVEVGEAVEDAAKRELFEETGLTAKSLELIGVYSGKEMLHTYPNGDKAYIVAISYLCEDFCGEPLTETDETSGLRWFPLDALPENISPLVKLTFPGFLEKIKKKYGHVSA
jgi:8-oxo-dGTP pyrophosphatase MutT (NUDIX family)